MATKQQPAKMGGRFSKAIRRTFEGLSIVDAVTDMALVVRKQDVAAARGSQKDASNCVIAKACRSKLGSSKVVIFRRVAYIELPDADGTRLVKRFFLSDEAAAIVRAFDRGKKVQGEVTVTLKAPNKSNTLDECRKRSIRRRRAIMSGEVEQFSTETTFPRPRKADLDIRNGSGQVQNTLVKASK